MEKILKSRELGKRFFPLIATIFIFILLSNWFSLVPGVGSVFVTVPVPAETNVIHANSVSDFETVEEKMEITNTEESERVSLFYPLSADLNFNLALAIIAFIAITVSGIMYLGIKKYIEKFIVFSSPMNFFSGIIALLLEVTRFVSFSFRLFRNLFTRKTLTLVIIILFLPFLFPLPFMLHQVFFGFIHASFFSLLTLFFIKLAIVEPL